MELTKENIRIRLQVSQCRLVVQGLNVIDSQRRGKTNCKYALSQIMTGFNLIDSIIGYDPEFENNCLTTIQVQHILDRICLLAPILCTPSTFSNAGTGGNPSQATGNAIQNLQNQINALRADIADDIEID